MINDDEKTIGEDPTFDRFIIGVLVIAVIFFIVCVLAMFHSQ